MKIESWLEQKYYSNTFLKSISQSEINVIYFQTAASESEKLKILILQFHTWYFIFPQLVKVTSPKNSVITGIYFCKFLRSPLYTVLFAALPPFWDFFVLRQLRLTWDLVFHDFFLILFFLNEIIFLGRDEKNSKKYTPRCFLLYMK